MKKDMLVTSILSSLPIVCSEMLSLPQNHLKRGLRRKRLPTFFFISPHREECTEDSL